MKRTILILKESETAAMNGLALARIARGQKVYNLATGEPMVPVSPKLIRAVTAALRAGKTHYPPISGIPELRSAAARWAHRTRGSRYTAEETLVVPGGKFGIFILLQALVSRGDEVLVPAPYWVSYPVMIRIFKGVPKIIPSAPASGWKISPDDIVKHATKKTKVLILNNGVNPTGALYSRRELSGILEAAASRGIFVISDEVYSGLVYEGAYVSVGSFPKYRKEVAIIESASKNFAMTGFRIGLVFLKDAILMKTLADLVSQSTTGVATASQWAFLAALKDASALTRFVRTAMKKRRDAFLLVFEKEFGVELPPPPSALYSFVPLVAMGWHGRDSARFCRRAIDEAGVALVPGHAFGVEGYVRFSFSGGPHVITDGIRALKDWIRKTNGGRWSYPRG